MKVLIVTDQRISYIEGKYCTEKAFWNNLKRYQKKFNNIEVYAKSGNAQYNSSEMIEDIEVHLGGNNVDLYFGRNKKNLAKLIPKFDLVILRVPSILAFQAASICKKINVPYFTVVVGCVWDSFWNHGIVGKFLAPFLLKRMKNVIKDAKYSSYVSEQFLQSRYPCSCKSLKASDVVITDVRSEILEKRLLKIRNKPKNTICLFTAAGLNVRYKGQQYVIGAIKYLNQLGYRVEYILVGTGDSSYLKSVANKYGVSSQVNILGAVPQEKVIDLMDICDIYIQPSLQEGLPRAVVEAFSRACPCIGTGAGGMGELIKEQYCFKMKNSKSIADMIINVWNDESLQHMAIENFQQSKKYIDYKLEKKRNDYFEYIIEDLKKD